MTCNWCPEQGLFTIHGWVLCARHFILHITAHDSGRSYRGCSGDG